MTIENKKIDELKAPSKKGAFKGDGWQNIISAVGTEKDKSTYNDFDAEKGAIGLDRATIESLFRHDGIGKNIVQTPAKDAIKNWVSITDDQDGVIAKNLNSIKSKKAIKQLVIDARKYGGAVVLITTFGGGALNKPIKPNAQIKKLINLTRHDFQLRQSELVLDVNSENFNDFETMWMKTGAKDIEIHRSRLLIARGESLATTYNGSLCDFEDWFWGDSILTAVFKQLGYHGTSLSVSNTLLQELTISVLKFSDLKGLLSRMSSTNQQECAEATKDFQMRLQAIAMTKSSINAIIVDSEEGEDMTRDSINLAGVKDIVEIYERVLCSISNIPNTKLFGQSPGGMNATGESDNGNYNDSLIDIQENVEELVQHIVDIQTKSKSKYIVAFKHPQPPTQQEQVDMNEKQSKTDKVYVEMGALDADEVRQSRFVGEESLTTLVEGEASDIVVDSNELKNYVDGK